MSKRFSFKREANLFDQTKFGEIQATLRKLSQVDWIPPLTGDQLRRFSIREDGIPRIDDIYNRELTIRDAKTFVGTYLKVLLLCTTDNPETISGINLPADTSGFGSFGVIERFCQRIIDQIGMESARREGEFIVPSLRTTANTANSNSYVFKVVDTLNSGQTKTQYFVLKNDGTVLKTDSGTVSRKIIDIATLRQADTDGGSIYEEPQYDSWFDFQYNIPDQRLPLIRDQLMRDLTQQDIRTRNISYQTLYGSASIDPTSRGEQFKRHLMDSIQKLYNYSWAYGIYSAGLKPSFIKLMENVKSAYESLLDLKRQQSQNQTSERQRAIDDIISSLSVAVPYLTQGIRHCDSMNTVAVDRASEALDSIGEQDARTFLFSEFSKAVNTIAHDTFKFIECIEQYSGNRERGPLYPEFAYNTLISTIRGKFGLPVVDSGAHVDHFPRDLELYLYRHKRELWDRLPTQFKHMETDDRDHSVVRHITDSVIGSDSEISIDPHYFASTDQLTSTVLPTTGYLRVTVPQNKPYKTFYTSVARLAITPQAVLEVILHPANRGNFTRLIKTLATDQNQADLQAHAISQPEFARRQAIIDEENFSNMSSEQTKSLLLDSFARYGIANRV